MAHEDPVRMYPCPLCFTLYLDDELDQWGHAGCCNMRVTAIPFNQERFDLFKLHAPGQGNPVTANDDQEGWVRGDPVMPRPRMW
jgi:hypothetical protein